MKPLYSRFCSALLTLVLIISLNNPANAQPHAPGDIAFTGYHSQTDDRFSFVLLKNFTAGQTISFTDGSWLNATNNFDIDEGMITWTVPAGGLIAGREVIINCFTNTASLLGSGAPGTVTVNTSSVSLNTSGDQITAFTGTLAAPTSVLSCLHMNVLDIVEQFDPCNTTDATWDGTCATGNNSYNYKPSGGGLNTLTNGTNALWIGNIAPGWTEYDNARFNCANLPGSTTVAALRAALNNKANWTGHQGVNPQSTIPLPAGCTWLGLAPLAAELVSNFTGKLNADKTVTLQWTVEAQQDVQEFILEESADGSSFSRLGTVTPGASNSYSYLDAQVSTGKNYYRLKTVELSGKITYSNIVLINLKAGIKVSLYPNPVTDKLTIQQFGAIQSKSAVLSDGRGNILQQIKLTSQQQTVNMETYPAGVYILKMEDGTVFKVVKQ